MIKTRIDKLLDTWKDTKDPDPEWSGAAYDYFKSQIKTKMILKKWG